MIDFETILWDVLREHTPDLKERRRLAEKMKTTGVYGAARGEYEADGDVTKCKELLREAMREALHGWKRNHE